MELSGALDRADNGNLASGSSSIRIGVLAIATHILLRELLLGARKCYLAVAMIV